MIKKFFKRLMCSHIFQDIDIPVMQINPRQYKCKKCGKKKWIYNGLMYRCYDKLKKIDEGDFFKINIIH